MCARVARGFHEPWVNRAHDSPTGSALRWMKEGVNVGQHLIPVHVIPGSEKFEIVGWDPWRNALKIKIKSRPKDGRANSELVRELSRLLGCHVAIKLGRASRSKLLVLTCEDDEFLGIKVKLGLP